MNFINMLTIFFPSILMDILTVITLYNMDISTQQGLQFKGLFIVSIVLIYPLIFLIQGMMCSIKETNIFITICAFLKSITCYIYSMSLYSMDAAQICIYSLFYSMLWISGYFSIYTIKKIKNKSK